MAVIKNMTNSVFTKNVVNSVYAYTYGQPATFTQISILLVSGTATLQGFPTGVTTDAINLPLNVPFNLTSSNNLPLDAFTINATTGTVILVGTLIKSVP